MNGYPALCSADWSLERSSLQALATSLGSTISQAPMPGSWYGRMRVEEASASPPEGPASPGLPGALPDEPSLPDEPPLLPPEDPELDPLDVPLLEPLELPFPLPGPAW